MKPITEALAAAKRAGGTGAILTKETFAKLLAETLPQPNRAQRRAAGQRGRAVPLEFFKPELDIFVPRYVRRHAKQVGGRTRRSRKARARAVRQMASYGMMP